MQEACAAAAWQVHAWCLMSNHFHLVVETPQPNLVARMKWLLGIYTKEHDLPTQPKGARPKVATALRLRKETTLTLRWIADRLEMGSRTYVSNLLSAERTARKGTRCVNS